MLGFNHCFANINEISIYKCELCEVHKHVDVVGYLFSFMNYFWCLSDWSWPLIIQEKIVCLIDQVYECHVEMKWGKYLDSDNCFFSEFSSWLPIRILSYLCLINTKKLVERIGLNLMDLCFKMIEANIDVINCNDINRITLFSFRELQKWYTGCFQNIFHSKFPCSITFFIMLPDS